MDTLSSKVRRTLLAVAENESLFFWMIFLEEVMLCNGLFINYIEQIKLLRSHIILPWGMTLCALRLCRREQKNSIRFTQWDVRFLVVLLLWMVVPFAVRFGFTPYRIVMMQGTAIIFFGLYAKLTEECVQQRERLLDQVSALFAVLSFVYGSALFYCVLTGQVFGEELGDMAFGVGADGMLYGGVYYNVTGMMANCCGLMSLVGFFRRKHKIAKLAHLIPAAMMAVVVVLTQSRTSRYAMLAALAAGAYGAIACSGKLRSAVPRQAAALAAAAAVLVGGYVAADELTTAALRYYDQPTKFTAIAEELNTQVESPAAEPEEQAYEGRGLGDATFTGRTWIWKKLINDWKTNPKYFVIGHGIGNTPKELGVYMAHNACLQMIMEYGLIGFALLVAFLMTTVRPVLYVFFAKKKNTQRGDRVLCMMVICALVTGTMESQPFMAMTPINMTLFFCLGLLVSRGREIMKNAE